MTIRLKSVFDGQVVVYVGSTTAQKVRDGAIVDCPTCGRKMLLDGDTVRASGRADAPRHRLVCDVCRSREKSRERQDREHGGGAWRA